MSDTATLDRELNQMILTGKALDAFEKFYADDVVMIEPDARFEGKDTNRKREQDFFAMVKEFHGGEVLASANDGNTTFSEWLWDLTFADGNRVKMEQVARRTWKDGKVVEERFYYNKG